MKLLKVKMNLEVRTMPHCSPFLWDFIDYAYSIIIKVVKTSKEHS